MKPTLKAIHICNSIQPPHKPKIAKEYVLPTLASLWNKANGLTTYIKNSGLSAKTKMSIINLRSVKIRKVSVRKSAIILTQNR